MHRRLWIPLKVLLFTALIINLVLNPSFIIRQSEVAFFRG